MGVSGLARDRASAEIERLCRQGHDVEVLCSETVRCLKRIVPFEAYAMGTMDPLTGLPTSMAHSEELANEEETRFFFEHIYFEDDVNEYGWMARKRIAVARLSDGTRGKLERALRHREFNEPKGFGYELRAVLMADGILWGGLCLIREAGSPDFSELEVEFIERISPHLGAGLRAAALRPPSRLEPAGDETVGVLMLDRCDRIVHRNTAADRLLEELGGTGTGAGYLPFVVWAAVGALRRAVANTSDIAGATNLHVRGRSGRWFTLQASPVEPQPGRASGTMVAIFPAGPRALAGLHEAAYGLTAREREVVDLVVRGYSTRQISAALFISESTVQGHLSHIFEKVGVRSRREILKRLFLDSLMPKSSSDWPVSSQ